MERKPAPPPAFGAELPRLPRSAPAQNPLPAPVITTAPTPSSASRASNVSTISSTIGPVSEFRRSGSLRVRTATRSRFSTSTMGMAGNLDLDVPDDRGGVSEELLDVALVHVVRR